VNWRVRETGTVNYSIGLVDILSRFCNDFTPTARVKNVEIVGGGMAYRDEHRRSKLKRRR
jgi:hypothetical protein